MPFGSCPPLMARTDIWHPGVPQIPRQARNDAREGLGMVEVSLGRHWANDRNERFPIPLTLGLAMD